MGTLKRGALAVLAVLLVATVPIFAAPSQQTAPAEAHAINANINSQSAHAQREKAPQTPLTVEAHVTGELKTTAENAGQETSSENNRWLDPISIFTGLLVLVGAGQVWFLRNTDIATTKAANAAKASTDAVVSQLRAYISVGPIESSAPTFDPNITVLLEVKNRGQTPAYSLISQTTVDVLPFPQETEFPIAKIEGIGSKCDLDKDAVLTLRATRHALSQEERERLVKGAARIYVYGLIRFADAFNNERYKRYALMIPVEPDGRMLGLQYCASGNDSN